MLANKEKHSQDVMISCLKSAYEYAMELHEQTEHNLHLIMGGDFGWALVHNGNLVKYFVNAGKNNKGTARQRLENIAQNVPNKGWIGIVMAGMESANYHTNFEFGVLRADARMTKAEFEKRFTKIKIL